MKFKMSNPGEAMGERNDCTVRALSNFCGIPYDKAHDIMASLGRKPRKGIHFKPVLKDAMRLAGMNDYHQIAGYPLAGSPRTIAQLVRAYPEGNIFVLISRHATVIKDGVILDSWKPGARCRIRYAYLSTQPETAINQQEEPKMKTETAKPVELLTAAECILKHGLGWNVAEKAVVIDGETSKEYKAIVREDNRLVMQICKMGYKIVQNAEAFSLFDEVIKSGGAKYEKAGCYNGGKVVWVRARLPHDFEVLPGDKVKTYIDIFTSHDGSRRLQVFPYVERLICSNGLRAMVRSTPVMVKHTASIKERFIANASEILAEQVEYFAKFKEAAQKLAAKRMNSMALDSFLASLFNVDGKPSERVQEHMEAIRQLALKGTGQDIPGVSGTAWAAYNGVTEWVDRKFPANSEERRAFSSALGSGAELRERAFAILTR